MPFSLLILYLLLIQINLLTNSIKNTFIKGNLSNIKTKYFLSQILFKIFNHYFVLQLNLLNLNFHKSNLNFNSILLGQNFNLLRSSNLNQIYFIFNFFLIFFSQRHFLIKLQSLFQKNNLFKLILLILFINLLIKTYQPRPFRLILTCKNSIYELFVAFDYRYQNWLMNVRNLNIKSSIVLK